MDSGALYVMISGDLWMHKWPVDNLGFLILVCFMTNCICTTNKSTKSNCFS